METNRLAVMNLPAMVPVKRRILIVDDHPLVRMGLCRWIDQQPDLKVCGEADCSRAAWAAIDRLQPDLVILDLCLRGENGLELIKDLRSRFGEMRILVLSQSDEALFGRRALRAGAQGYIMKERSPETLLNAIHTVLENRIYTSEALGGLLLRSLYKPDPDPCRDISEQLSDRELEVFELLGVGLGTREIAARLKLGLSTVESHRESLKSKFGLKNGFHLVQVAMQWVQNQASAPLREVS